MHAAESIDDLAGFVREVRAGELPHRPYLVVGQHTLIDPGRAPPGRHTLYAYSRVPSNVAGGWAAARERFADRAEERLEGLAPGFRGTILARHVLAPPDLEAMNQNLRGGDLGGGSNAWNHQLLFRPAFPYFRYRTPVSRLYLCSSYAHPGRRRARHVRLQRGARRFRRHRLIFFGRPLVRQVIGDGARRSTRGAPFPCGTARPEDAASRPSGRQKPKNPSES